MYQKCNINKVCLIDWSIHTGIQTQRVGKWTQVADQEELRVSRRSKQWECNTQLGNSVAVQWHTQKIIKKDMHDIQISKNNFTSKSRVIITNPTIHFEKLSICSKPICQNGRPAQKQVAPKGGQLCHCACMSEQRVEWMVGKRKRRMQNLAFVVSQIPSRSQESLDNRKLTSLHSHLMFRCHLHFLLHFLFLSFYFLSVSQ